MGYHLTDTFTNKDQLLHDDLSGCCNNCNGWLEAQPGTTTGFGKIKYCDKNRI